MVKGNIWGGVGQLIYVIFGSAVWADMKFQPGIDACSLMHFNK
ncbi:hypothetical protein SpAn4DRAFT_4843 [Sporomusa ovata]|uniref:Uncharacterized protein n=1 Tax=Sporomusa ovata TaxID=2378 RepID=A0A0U1KRD2_9FIRM|nr:hypothetical protein [Sporomusa ovata]CQR69978.1 hypothetical protein SpAn4DRAFT_4843 [Sporomusa ovata]